jgi:DNA-binding transcriptional MerR regulator
VKWAASPGAGDDVTGVAEHTRVAGKSMEAQPGQSDGKNGKSRLPRGRPVPLPLIPTSPRYSILDLEAETGFNSRTIRYYISEGMLTPAHGRGKSATYDKDHLLRLRMIRDLKNQFLPLETIKERLADLDTDDLESHFAIQTAPAEGKWRRIVFHPDLEMHVRERDQRDYRLERMIEQIIQHARFVMENYEDTR